MDVPPLFLALQAQPHLKSLILQLDLNPSIATSNSPHQTPLADDMWTSFSSLSIHRLELTYYCCNSRHDADLTSCVTSISRMPNLTDLTLWILSRNNPIHAHIFQPLTARAEYDLPPLHSLALHCPDTQIEEAVSGLTNLNPWRMEMISTSLSQIPPCLSLLHTLDLSIPHTDHMLMDRLVKIDFPNLRHLNLSWNQPDEMTLTPVNIASLLSMQCPALTTLELNGCQLELNGKQHDRIALNLGRHLHLDLYMYLHFFTAIIADHSNPMRFQPNRSAHFPQCLSSIQPDFISAFSLP